MSLDKAIEHGKEKRKPYTGDKAVDNECRNHGSCSWCREKRLKYKKTPLMLGWKNIDKKKAGRQYNEKIQR